MNERKRGKEDEVEIDEVREEYNDRAENKKDEMESKNQRGKDGLAHANSP